MSQEELEARIQAADAARDRWQLTTAAAAYEAAIPIANRLSTQVDDGQEWLKYLERSGYCTNMLGVCLSPINPIKARSYLDQAVESFFAQEDPIRVANIERDLGTSYWYDYLLLTNEAGKQAALVQATIYFMRSRDQLTELATTNYDRNGMALTRAKLALAYMAANQTILADQEIAIALRILKERTKTPELDFPLGTVLLHAAEVAFSLKELSAAERYVRQAEQTMRLLPSATYAYRHAQLQGYLAQLWLQWSLSTGSSNSIAYRRTAETHYRNALDLIDTMDPLARPVVLHTTMVESVAPLLDPH